MTAKEYLADLLEIYERELRNGTPERNLLCLREDISRITALIIRQYPPKLEIITDGQKCIECRYVQTETHSA